MNMFTMFKSYTKNMNIMWKERKNIRRFQVEILTTKNKIPEVKNSVNGIMTNQVNAQVKINELEDIVIETIQSDTQRKD